MLQMRNLESIRLLASGWAVIQIQADFKAHALSHCKPDSLVSWVPSNFQYNSHHISTQEEEARKSQVRSRALLGGTQITHLYALGLSFLISNMSWNMMFAEMLLSMMHYKDNALDFIWSIPGGLEPVGTYSLSSSHFKILGMSPWGSLNLSQGVQPWLKFRGKK